MGYSPVFSASFIEYTDAEPNAEFAVPIGFTAVVRDFSIFTYVGAGAAQLTIQNDEDAAALTVAAVSVAGAFVYDQWQGRVVCPGGGIIGIVGTTIGSGNHIYAGGYLLRNVAT